MMKLRKLLPFIALSALAIVGCKKNDLGTDSPTPNTETGTTYMTFSFNASEALRADGDPEDQSFNGIGEWNGKDKFENAYLYIFPAEDPNSPAQAITLTEITPGSNDGMYKAENAWKTTPGNKIVFAVINLKNTDVKSALDLAAKTGLSSFTHTFDNEVQIIKEADDNVVKADFATVETGGKDVITMTGMAKQINVKDGVTKEQAEAGQNQVNLNVRRIVARVLTTADFDGTYESADKVKDEYTGSGEEKPLFTMKDFEWSYAQYEKNSYFLFRDYNYKFKQPQPIAEGHEYTPASMVMSPRYDTNIIKVKYKKNDYRNDYAYDLVTKPTFFELKNFKRTSNPEDVKKIVAENMRFIPETTHKCDTYENIHGGTASNYYQKGNTAYVLIRATYIPAPNQMGMGLPPEPIREEYNGTGDLYYGLKDGKFYKTYQAAYARNNNDPVEEGKSLRAEIGGEPVGPGEPTYPTEPVPGEKDNVITYKDGKVYYIAWINPNVIDPLKWVCSPVVRNNIYHINIKGFKRIGWSGNPFNPDPKNPLTPDPDEDPLLPDPDEPLYSTETYMHATVKVIKWGVHSYDIEL